MVAQVVEEGAHNGGVETGLAGDDRRPDRVEAVETGGLVAGRRGGRLQLEGGRLRVEFQTGELAVEGVDEDGGSAEGNLRLRCISQRLMRAAQPIVAARLAQGTVGRIGEHLEVAERQLGIAQMAQRQPAGQEGRILAGVVGQAAGIAHEVIGQIGLASLQRRVGAGAPLLPPAVRLDEHGRRGLGEQDLPGFLVLLLPAQGLRHLHGHAPFGLRLGRQLGNQLGRVLGAA